MNDLTVRSVRDVWTAENARGLALAAASSWPEAADAFSRAVDAVNGTHRDFASHDALALVLGNLAQACFRAGRIDDGIRHAQRACALRAALVGEDAISSARARADLAVMLGSTGRLDEASALMDRAIACMEQNAGEDDMRLLVPLENAARLALASAHPANAEPHLLRLHALLAEHGLPTSRADILLARVASARVRLAPIAVREPDHTLTARAAAPQDEASAPRATDVTASSEHAEPQRVASSSPARTSMVRLLADTATTEDAVRGVPHEAYPALDDHHLRDAVRAAESLLRTAPHTTPSATSALVDNTDGDVHARRKDSNAEVAARADAVRLDLVDEFLDRPDSPVATSDAELEDAEIEDAVVEVVETEVLVEENDDTSLFESASDGSPAGLGFAVEHGLRHDDSAPPWYEVTGFGPAEIGRIEPAVEPTLSSRPETPKLPAGSSPADTPTGFDGRPPEVRFYVTPAEGVAAGDVSAPTRKHGAPPAIPLVFPTPHRGTAAAQHAVRNVASRENNAVRSSAPRGSPQVRSAADFSRSSSHRRARGEATNGTPFWQVWLWGAFCVVVGCAAIVLYFRVRPV